jgi:hypothetical protein
MASFPVDPKPVQSPAPAPMAGEAADRLAGSDDTQEQSGQSGMRNVVMEIRRMEQRVIELARQFPTAAKSARQVSEGIRAMLRQIVANPGGPEPLSPEGE